MSDDANLTGRGADILLPPQGNPFKRPPESDSSAADPGMGKAALAGAPAAVEDGVGGVEEPADLSPADIAAMFPATQDERNTVPSGGDPATPNFGSAIGSATHEGARLSMTIPSGDPAHAPKAPAIDLSNFNPDEPIGRPLTLTRAKAPIRSKVDIAAFNPDAPAEPASGDSAAANDAANAAPVADTSTPITGPLTDTAPVDIKADAPIGTDAPSIGAPTVPLTDTTSAQPPIDLAPPSSAPSVPPPTDVSLPAGGSIQISTPASGSAPISVTVTPTDGASSPLDVLPPTPGASAPPSSAPTPAPGQAAMVVSTPGATVAATVAAPPSIDDDSPGSAPSEMLPTVPAISLPVVEDAAILERLVTDDRMMDIWRRIDRIEALAVQDENSLPVQRTRNFENLKAARNLLLGGRKNYEDALRYVDEVEASLGYIKRVRRWSYSWGTVLFFYNVAWVALLALGYLSAARIGDQFAANGLDRQFGIALWITIVSGGLGGVSKSLFALSNHVVKQDFDVQHRLWYYESPFIGSIMGIFVYIISQIGIVAVSAGSSNGASAGYAVYILAWVVGFQQNLVLELVEKVKETILPEDKNKNPS